jgi:NDP-sugar pyrophosphorylase family protein
MTNVIILAGGKGERMRPVTEDRPKSMVSVMGKPLLACLFQWLSAYGFRNITLACGYRYQVIQDYFGDGATSRAKSKLTNRLLRLDRGRLP